MSNARHTKLETRVSPVTVRETTRADAEALARLAALDSSHTPAQPALVAEVGDQPLAAISTVDGSVVADPFHRTAELIEMLRVRAGLTGARNGSWIRALGRTRRPQSEPRVPRPSAPSVPGIPVLPTPSR
jgi:hypothetical protein